MCANKFNFYKIFLRIKFIILAPLTEIAIICVLSHYILDLPITLGIALGCLIAAVSPAIVIPILI